MTARQIPDSARALSAPGPEAARTKRGQTDRLETALLRHFGHSSFRPGQEDVVRAVLAGRDVARA